MTNMEFKRENIVEILGLIQTLRNETVPLVGHSDIGAINDCWNSLNDLVEALIREYNYSEGHAAYMNEILNSNDGVYRS